MKYGTLFTLLLLMALQIHAQKKVGGEWSVGPRLGGSSGISLKKHGGISNGGTSKSALEFIAANSFDKKVEGFTLSALYEKLGALNGNGQLSALFGAGVNLNFKDDTKLGVSGILGFDWRLKAIPVTLQIDWLPTYFFVNESYFSGVNGAFTIRYILNRNRYEDRDAQRKKKAQKKMDQQKSIQ